MGRDVSFEDSFSDDGASECGKVTTKQLSHYNSLSLLFQDPVYPLRPSLFPNVPPYVQFIPVIFSDTPDINTGLLV